MDAAQLVQHVRLLRAAGAAHRPTHVPRQRYPKLVELEYGKAMIGLVDRARPAIAPVLSALPGLLASARAARHDAGEVNRLAELLDQAKRHLAAAIRPTEIEALARRFGQRTQDTNREQLRRQVRAALGVDVLASDRRLPALLDHFVAENAALIKTIPADLVGHVEKLATRAFTTGRSSADVQADLEERFDIEARHARLIARDQIGKLYGQTNADRQQDLGIEAFRWQTSEDERVRPEHKLLDGQVFRYDQPPAEGLPGVPICCRCYAEPVLDHIIAAI